MSRSASGPAAGRGGRALRFAAAAGLVAAVAAVTIAAAATAAAGVSTAAAAATTPERPAALRYGMGQPATPAQIAGWDIDVRPDGTGLPDGKGSVAEGQVIYDAKCANCHGTFGESNDYLAIAGGVGTLGSVQPVRATGSKLNHATTLFDYIRRAMPFNAPKTLTDHEVYALTAYVLNLSDIVPTDAVLDRTSLVALRLPNRDGFTTDHGLSRVDGRPDTHNRACMNDCVASVRVVSEIPAYARGSHGEIDAQMRRAGWDRPHGMPAAADGVGADAANGVGAGAAAADASRPSALARASACMTCHDATRTVVGPAFAAVARKYAGDDQAVARLAAKIRAGGSGSWGAVPMPAQAQVAPAQAEVLARWILGGAQ
jgi:cytochrome c